MPVNLVIDSGAFSAWNSGKVIEVEEYADWLQDKAKYLWYYFSLDVIPAVRGRAPTPKEANEAARGSYENYCRMKDLGLDPVPVLHQFEDFSWLDKMLELNPPIIGVSPNKAIPMRDRLAWAEAFFSYVCGENPYPKEKYHGLGVSSPRLVMPFPWYSFDTTNPILAAGRAELAIPRLLRDGSPDWNRSTFYASITRRAKMNSRHLEFMGQPLEDHIRALTKAAGEDFDVLRESRCLRFRYNAHIFKEQFSH